jgi:hypothetical protein
MDATAAIAIEADDGDLRAGGFSLVMAAAPVMSGRGRAAAALVILCFTAKVN